MSLDAWNDVMKSRPVQKDGFSQVNCWSRLVIRDRADGVSYERASPAKVAQEAKLDRLAALCRLLPAAVDTMRHLEETSAC